MSFGAGILLPQRYTNNTTGPGSLHLDFLTGAPLDSRITFTRSTTATFVGSNGLIQSSAINTPRFDYNPATLAPLGLLIEEQRANTMNYSDSLDTSAQWGQNAVTVTANAGTSPDGTANADAIIPNTSVASHTLSSTTLVSIGSTYAVSIFAKMSGYRYVAFKGLGLGASGGAIFDLQDGVVVASNLWSSVNIKAFSNGWYRLSAVGTATGTAGPIYCVYDNPNNLNFAGDGVSGILMYGAQAEIGGFATSYIPTAASAVTRAADIATMTGTNFSSWYNASEGTFVASFEASPNAYTTYLAASNGVVAQNSVHIDNDIGGNMRAPYYSGSSNVALLSLGAVGTLNAVNKVATAYKVNDFAASRNGGAVVTDTAGAVPVGVVQLNIGADPSGAAVNVSNTHIRSITYYASRLTNAQLQALSS
jgi:hypothetical protein